MPSPHSVRRSWVSRFPCTTWRGSDSASPARGRCGCSSGSRGRMARRTWSSTPSSSWDGWRCSCRGRGSTWCSTTACWGPGRPGGRRSCLGRRCRRGGQPRAGDTPGQSGPGEVDATTADADRQRARGWLWADLMRRTFGFDVLACPRCDGRLRLIAVIDHNPVIQKILRHLGLPSEIPVPTPARAPPPEHADSAVLDFGS